MGVAASSLREPRCTDGRPGDESDRSRRRKSQGAEAEINDRGFLVSPGEYGGRRAAQKIENQVSKVSSEDRMQVHGVSGTVNRVYSSEKATLKFAHFQQPNLDIITLDLSTISRHTGMEVSGFLGFAMLRQLEIEFDYRDGLVDFKYDPKRVNVLAR